MLVGGAILMVGSAVAGDRPDLGAVGPAAWWAWVYMAVVVSLAGFSSFAYALASLPVSTVATYAYVNPVIAVLLGVLAAGERFSVAQMAGGGLVLAAVLVVIAAERPRKRQGRLAPSPA
jgi:drug/metabolite transporter (DMT)-like permease